MDGIGSGCGRVGAVSVWHDAGQSCGDVAEYASRGGKTCGDHSGYVGGKYSNLRYVLVTRKSTGGVRHRGSAGVLTPQPCIPVIAGTWTAVQTKCIAGGKPCLTTGATAVCSYGGTLSIINPGQTTVLL